MIYALLSALFFGSSDAFWKPVIAKYSYNSIVLSRTVFSSLFLLVFVLLSENLNLATFPDYLLVLFLGTISAFAFMYLIKAFELAATSIVITLNSVTLIVSQITAFLFFDELVNWKNYSLVFVFIMLAVLLLNNLKFKLNTGIKYALISSVLFGIAYPLLSIPVHTIGNYQTAALQELTLLFWIVVYVYKRPHVEKTKLLVNKEVLVLAILSAGGLSLLFYAYSFMEVYKVHLISSFYPIPALLIAFFIYKEKISIYQFFGIILSILSTYLISTNFI